MKLLLTANSPGEVAWIRAIAAELQARNWTCDVILYPCTFATGREVDVVRTYPGIERVWDNRSFPKLWWSEGRRYPAGTPLLHLGGDLMYTAFLSWRWKWNCWSYLWARHWWDSAFRGYFSRNAQSTAGLLKRRIGRDKIVEVGDLIVDAARFQVPQLPAKDPRLISFMPGSRLEEVRHMVPFCARVAELLSRDFPDLRYQIMLSPFMPLTSVQEQLRRPTDPRMDVTFGALQGESYVCASGLELPLVQQSALSRLAESVLAVSLPGTKTAEAGVLGVPTLTLLPLNCPEQLPYGGLIGLLDWVPGGSHWKGEFLRRQKGKIGLVAQPNQLLGERIMPEIVDVVSARQVAGEVAALLRDRAALQEKGLLIQQAYDRLAGCSRKMLDCLAPPR